MKVVIIILLLVAVSFVAVMVYGVTRDEPPPPATARRDDCGKPPPKLDKDDPDPDVLEDWCPPDFGSFVDTVRLRYTPSLDVEQPEVALNGVQPQMRRVKADLEEELRIARIALVSGRAAKVTSQRLDGERRSDTLCLCRPGTIDPDDFPGCGSRWLAKQVASSCKDGDLGVLPFGPLGGALNFTSIRPARLVVNPADQDAED